MGLQQTQKPTILSKSTSKSRPRGTGTVRRHLSRRFACRQNPGEDLYCVLFARGSMNLCDAVSGSEKVRWVSYPYPGELGCGGLLFSAYVLSHGCSWSRAQCSVGHAWRCVG